VIVLAALGDDNNAVYSDGASRIYMVSDLGTSFGSAGITWPFKFCKDNLSAYSRSRFIRRIRPDTVDFEAPARPRFVYLAAPREYFSYVRMERIGRHIPRADARWLGELLGRLSSAQIRGAFRSAGYSAAEIDGFSKVLENRLTALTEL
jgi:hypothetical protein